MTLATLEAPVETSLEDVVDENAGIPPVLLDLMGRIEMEPTFKSERGLLYSFRGRTPKPQEFGSADKAVEYEVLVKPETITFRSITQTCGVNRHSQKIYRSWKTDRAITLSLKYERQGHRVVRIYENLTRTKKYRGSFTNATAKFVNVFEPSIRFNGEVPELFRLEDVKPEHTFLSAPDLHTVAVTFASWAFYHVLKELDPTNPAFTAKSFTATAAYPVLQLFPNSVFNVESIRKSVPKNFSLHSEPDVKKFIAKNFGTDGIRKDMVKAVVNSTDINALFLAERLKHLYPLDWLRDLVKSPSEFAIYDSRNTYSKENVEGLVALLSTLTLPQRKRLLFDKAPVSRGHDESFVIRDAVRMFAQINPQQREEYRSQIDMTSWEEFHNTLSTVFYKIREKERANVDSLPYVLDKTYMATLNGTSYVLDGETYHIYAPKNRGDLDRWGNAMHNCIGSYHRQVVDRSTNVFAIHHNNNLIANIEINFRGQIVQYMEKYNSPASQEHHEALRKHIAEVDEKVAKKAASDKRVQDAMRRRITPTA